MRKICQQFTVLFAIRYMMSNQILSVKWFIVPSVIINLSQCPKLYMFCNLNNLLLYPLHQNAELLILPGPFSSDISDFMIFMLNCIFWGLFTLDLVS